MASKEINFDNALDALLDADPDDREALLQRYGDQYPDDILRLRRILQFALSDEYTLTSVEELAPSLLSNLILQNDKDRIGSEIGAYKITSLIDRGGMGIVFRAERNDGAYQQTVAVKFLPRLAKASDHRDLFLSERANLARLEHPNIARIIDAGVTDDETPYFIMEFVSGEKFDQYCKHLTERQKLSVFQELCDAVSYCHRSFVVHGDIKPSNILVANDRVRLLDFGIGKWTKENGEKSWKTGYTKEYAAPELVEGKGHTTATDIFALGQLLHNLLNDPTLKKHQKDLQWIVDRCIAPKPEDRFKSVDILKQEIEAYKTGFPITDRKSEKVYLFQKFFKRNWIGVSSLVAIMVSLGIGLSATLWQYGKAKEEAAKAQETSAFVKSLFDRIDPEDAGNEDITLRQIMDEAYLRIESEFVNAPEIRYEIMELIAAGYFGIGEYDKSLQMREEILSFHQLTKSSPHKSIAFALGAIGSNYKLQGDYDRGREVMQDAINQLEALEMENTLEMVDILGRYGLMLSNKTGSSTVKDEAIDIFIRKGEILDAVAPDDVYLKSIQLSNLASGYDEVGNFLKGVELKKRAVKLAEENDLSLRTTAITTLCNLGYSYHTLGLLEEAITTHQKCIERRIQRLGADHPDIISSKQNLAASYIDSGKFELAHDILTETVIQAEQSLPENSFSRLASEINLANVNLLLGDTEPALKMLPNILVRMEDATGTKSPAAARVKSLLGRAYLFDGEIETAVHKLQDAYTVLEASPYWNQTGSQWASDVAIWRAEAELAAGNIEAAMLIATLGLSKINRESNVSEWRLNEASNIWNKIQDSANQEDDL